MLGTTRIMLSAAACALGLPGFQFKASGFWVSGLGQGFGFRVWGPGLGGFSDAAMLAAMLAMLADAAMLAMLAMLAGLRYKP